ncbi:MAG: hypothetical protein EBT51_08710 [Flavobacteriaceae bacterium]|nr:hypothetical protein [Flavobacteriaceae bacterium]
MEEIVLIALGIYLLRKGGVPDYKSLPSGPELWDLILIANGQQGQPKGPDHLVCPWLWKKRPAIFNVVPINSKSRDNWLNLCDLWREIRSLGLDIEKYQAQIPTGKEEDVTQLEQLIKNAKNRQAFLLKETKRIADIQKRTEALYQRSLQNTFSENEIKDFYLKRKSEIEQGIWPKNDTQVVPIVSPAGGGRDRKAIDRGPIDPGNGVVQMGTKYDRDWLNKNPSGYDMPWYKADKKRIAAPPGKRVSSTGNVYYEYRINRSDEPGKNI